MGEVTSKGTEGKCKTETLSVTFSWRGKNVSNGEGKARRCGYFGKSLKGPYLCLLVSSHVNYFVSYFTVLVESLTLSLALSYRIIWLLYAYFSLSIIF